MESMAADLRQMQRTPLTEAHVEMLRAIGTERRYRRGELLADVGDPMDAFLYVEEGEVEAVDPDTGGRAVESTLRPTQYLGEITFLNGGNWSLPMRAVEDTRVTAVPRADMLALMARVPELSDIVVTVFAARRRATLEGGRTALTLIDAEHDRALRELLSFASRNRIPVRQWDLGSPEADAALEAAGLPKDRPAALFGRGRVIEDPTPRAVARLMGLDLPLGGEAASDVVIVGGGPAGIAAAVYAGAEGLRALVVEDKVIGGQAGSSSRIENYMGFPTGISGADLCFRGEIQAMRLGARFVMPRRAVGIAPEGDGYRLRLDDGEEITTCAVVIATGVQYRRLPLDGTARLEGAGVYYAATDIEARYCRHAEVVVIGGGNSAGQAAMFLSRTARHVHVLVRGDGLSRSMSSYLASRLEQDPAITVHYQCEIAALHGDEALTAVTWRHAPTGERRHLDTPALFVMVGAAPNTDWLRGLVELDDKGFVVTGCEPGHASPYATSAPGVFAVGDVRAGSVKRVASSVGEGSVVISKVWEHVHGRPRG